MELNHASPLTVSVPYPYYLDPLRERAARGELGDVRLVGWDAVGEPTEGVAVDELDVVVLPFHSTSLTPSHDYVSTHVLRETLPAATRARLVQAPSIGVEGLVECLPPGAVLSNAVGVMEQPTAELAVTLLLAVRREIPGFVQADRWTNHRTPGLLGSRVMLVGYGGIGQAIEARLAGFGVEVVRVASRARTTEDGGTVHAIADATALLPGVDAVLCSVPLNGATRGLVDAEFLAAMPDGAVLVNVGRGPVVDTEALVAELRQGRLLAALDVTDPEPLPPGHELFSTPGLLVTPHVGGNTHASLRLQVDLLADQVLRVAAGRRPRNVVGPVGAMT
ncbi:hydroxyacid dehydrogenase [Actinotalea sp. BY-33]|uniref:Hydroxyacid dehydrogenase n=1 Tax=Actinotalea soli TaxID=2819234 RepID=A0A939LS46_9CELL|nr:NAD(P)-dependent oxidoreductase [Actinotalea soli]MBO1751114.1 hydroxyacid dehydrogenase [Actinotalea soli]